MSDTNRPPSGPLSMKDLGGQARPRTADEEREYKEREAFDGNLRRGRQRRAIGRSEPVSIKTFPRIKKMLLDMADAEGKTYTEVFEDAIERRHANLKGTK